MKKYNFYDTDILGNDEYDIAGEKYTELLKMCFKYSELFSLRYSEGNFKVYFELAEYEVRTYADNVSDYKVVYYRACPKTYDILVKNANSIFCWMNNENNNPEDLMFFRSDGSILFSSVIHNGCLSLWMRDEDFSSVINDELWLLAECDARNNLYKKTSYYHVALLDKKSFASDVKELIVKDNSNIDASNCLEVDAWYDEKDGSFWTQYQCKIANENFIMITAKIFNYTCELVYEAI